VIRSTAQSLIDYVPYGATTEGFGGTWATQENFRIVRAALDEEQERLGRYLRQVNYSSGLCMPEIAWLGAVERLDMLLNDAMYGILFRDINPRRTLCDQYFSRRMIARAGIVINTGEDNYLTTADAVEKAHTVLASQFINESFAHNAGLPDEQMGLGHAFEIDKSIEDSFLMEISQAQLVRQIFPRHPIKWMPATKHKTGDIFWSHRVDGLFDLVGVATEQTIELLGMMTESIHTPLLQDRFAALKGADYVFTAARHLSDEIRWNPDGRIVARARQVLGEARDLLSEVAGEGMFSAIARGAFADVKRPETGGRGLHGVVDKGGEYLNPILDALEGKHD
jgi:beta-lysine 5,6-aminomutase alpha subunit